MSNHIGAIAAFIVFGACVMPAKVFGHDTTTAQTKGWQEFILTAGAGFVQSSELPLTLNMYGYGSQSYTAEYRYAVAPLLAVGGAVVYSPFFYDKPTAPGFEQPTRNHNLSFGPRLHIRTSRYAERESLILYTGFMATHYRFYTTTLYVENEFGDDSTMYVPDAAGISLGIPFGIGFESSPIIFNKVRVRFSIDFTMPVTGDNLGIASFFALGLGYNW